MTSFNPDLFLSSSNYEYKIEELAVKNGLTKDQCEELIDRINQSGRRSDAIIKSLSFDLSKKNAKEIIKNHRKFIKIINSTQSLSKPDSKITMLQKSKLYLFFNNPNFLNKGELISNVNVDLFVDSLEKYGHDWDMICEIFFENGILVNHNDLSNLFVNIMEGKAAQVPKIFTINANNNTFQSALIDSFEIEEFPQVHQHDIPVQMKNMSDEARYSFFEEALNDDSEKLQLSDDEKEEYVHEFRLEMEGESLIDEHVLEIEHEGVEEFMTEIPDSVSPNSPASPQSISSLSEDVSLEQLYEQEIVINTINEFETIDPSKISNLLQVKGIKKSPEQVRFFYEENRTKFFKNVKNNITRSTGSRVFAYEINRLKKIDKSKLRENSKINQNNIMQVIQNIEKNGRNWKRVSDELHKKYEMDIPSSYIQKFFFKNSKEQ